MCVLLLACPHFGFIVNALLILVAPYYAEEYKRERLDLLVAHVKRTNPAVIILGSVYVWPAIPVVEVVSTMQCIWTRVALS